MTKQILKYLMACIIAAASTGIAAAQSISLGRTTPAASGAHVGGLSYTYAIGRIDRIITKLPSNAAKPGSGSNAKMMTATAYPNPCSDLLKIKADEPIAATDATIQIIDSKGSIVSSAQAHDSDHGEISIDALQLAPGKYIIRIITANGTYTATAIKI
ncbi:MAG: T9SS type A sorting domain-containing protein [Bacteroidales bacterium]|nr:T9SS type A sorting domain-containing protein [Bacteroidales bacterium]